MPTNTPSCTPKASGKTMETKSVCDLAPWFLGRTPYFGLSMTLWLEQRSSHFWWTLCRTWWVSLACRNLIFFGEIQDLGLNLCPFLSSACFFLRKKNFESSLFSPWKSWKSWKSVCFLFRGSKEPQFPWWIGSWAEVRTVPARASSASSASGEAGMPGEGVILLGRSV